MNVKPGRTAKSVKTGASLAVLVALFAPQGSALAWTLSYELKDPLKVNPTVLSTGAQLPGESRPVGCPASADLQPVLSLVLALGEVVDIALCNNPQLSGTWAAIKVQAAAVGEARAAYWPTVNGSIARLYNRTRFPDTPAANTAQYGSTGYAGLTWHLFDFGGRAANQESANQLLSAAMAGHDAVLQKVLGAVVGAYFDALTSDAAQSARGQAASLAQSTYDATQRRETKGAAAVSDTLQTATALAKARLALRRAQGDAQKARSVLVYAMGLPTGVSIRLPASTDAAPAQSVQELQAWLTDAQARHPAIAAARAQLEAAKAKIVATRSEGLPSLDFTTNFYQNGYPNQGLQSNKTNVTTVGVTLQIPIFDGFARSYKIRGAQAQAEQSEAQLLDTEHQILTEVVKAHADALSSLGNLEFSENLLTAAQAAVDSSQRRYAKGAADVLELLATQSALADAQQERIRCLAEWRSARLRLMASAGGLGRTGIADDR